MEPGTERDGSEGGGLRREIRDRPDLGRYELVHDGTVVGVVQYQLNGSVATIPHVEVAASLRGGGHSAPFLDEVLELMVQRGFTILPLCGYAAGHIANRPDREQLLGI